MLLLSIEITSDVTDNFWLTRLKFPRGLTPWTIAKPSEWNNRLFGSVMIVIRLITNNSTNFVAWVQLIVAE
jgi:hypothetical protein